MQVKCTKCSFSFEKIDPFLDLSLEIVKADNLSKALLNYTIEDDLDKFVMPKTQEAPSKSFISKLDQK